MSSSPRPTLALIDASNYLYRAFHAIRGLSGPGGRPTNAVYGFATMLNKYRADRKPDAIAVAYDRKERTFRHDMDTAYKAQRDQMPDELGPQIEDAKHLCEVLGYAVLEEPGFEADDLIATLAGSASRAGLRVEIASMDKDLLQLVKDDRVVVWHPLDEALLDAAGVVQRFGVPPERVVDVLAIMGDSVDNIPGVHGIGEKGAKELVSTFGSLEDIYARLDEVKGKRREKLLEGKESAFRSRELATLRCDAPVGDVAPESLFDRFRIPDLDDARSAKLLALYDELGFAKLRRDLLAARSQPMLEAPPSAPREEAPAGSMRWEREERKVADFIERALSEERVGLHVESGPGKPYPPEPLVATLALRSGEALTFPLDAAGRTALSRLFASGATITVHDAKRLLVAAAVMSLPPPAHVEDVMLSAYMVAPGVHAHDLAGDARALLGCAPEAVPSLKDAFGATGVDSGESFGTDHGLAYLAPRARLPLELHDCLEARLTESTRGVLTRIEKPLVPVLARMELAGIAVDAGVLSELSTDFTKRLASLEKEIHEAAGEPFNIGSPQQLGRVLFEKLAYPVLRKTSKTKSYATDSEVLEQLAALKTGPLPRLVLEWRELSKLKGTYVDALPLHIAKDGRIHTRYDQAVAATGRLSSNDPNLQNIPIRNEAGRAIRRAFVAPEGRRLVVADYSQIELRILAHLSRDEALVDVFRKGEDIHRATAARVFGIDPGLVSQDQRRGAKTINFGILYGMGPYALASQLGVPQAEAKAFIKAYFERFPKIRACLDAILLKARETGATETIFGRTRPIPGLFDRNFAVRSNAERMAMNAPFQGSAADLIKLAMVALDEALLREGRGARLLLQVHDELVLECAEEDAEATARLAKETMEGAAALEVPLTVDVGVGRNWAEAK
jgi:DNA polymerase-1